MFDIKCSLLDDSDLEESRMPYKQFGNWLSSKLVEKRMKPADITRATGLDSGVLSNIINGKRQTPSVETLKLIAKALEIPLEEVYRAADVLPEKTTIDPVTEALLNIMVALDGDEKQDVLDYAKLRKQRSRDKKVHNTGNTARNQARTATT